MSTNNPLPQAYLFSSNGVFDSNNGIDFVTGVDDLGIVQTANASSLGMVVVISSNSVFIGNTTWFVNIGPPSPAQVAGGYVLTANGGWGPGGGGGAGGAGGSNGSIQYSNSGVIAGNGSFTYSNGVVTIGTGTLNATAWSGSANTANSASFIGTLPAANVVSNAQLQANLAPLVNTAQLSGNLANYTPTTGIPAIVGQNTANNSLYLGGFAANQYSFANQGGGVWTLRTANYTAAFGDRILADTSGGSFTVTLPASPANGAIVAFADQANTWATNNLTINPNGANVAGSSANLVCDQSAYFQLLYEKTGWQVSVTTPPASSPSGAIVYNTSQTLTANQAAQARANMGVTKKNYVINGSMQVSQENANNVLTTSVSYPVDQFRVEFSGGACSFSQVASLTPGGSPNRIRVTVTSTRTVVAGDYSYILTAIEGSRVVDLRFGTSSPRQVVFQIGCKGPVGTYGVSLRNGATNRTYVSEFTIAAGEANTDVVKSVTFVGDTSGTWATDNTAGFILAVGLMCGSTYQTTAGSWQAGNFLGTSNQFNFFGTNGNVFELFDVGLYEGAAAPAFVVHPYDEALRNCQRYFWNGVPAMSGSVASANQVGRLGCRNPVTMRASPSVTITSAISVYDGSSISTISGITTNYSTPSDVQFDSSNSASGLTTGHPAVALVNLGGNISVSARM